MILWGPVPLLRCLISSNVSTLNDNIFSSFLLISYMFVSEYQTVVICWFITGYSVHYVSHCSCTSLNMHNMIMLESSELFRFLLMWSTWRALWPPSGYAAIPVEKEKKTLIPRIWILWNVWTHHILFPQHQWQSWTKSLRSCTRSSWRRTSTRLPLCKSTRSSARRITSRPCSISPARHHYADVVLERRSVATLLYTCSLILVLQSTPWLALFFMCSLL